MKHRDLMKTVSRRTPSPAMVVACLALMIALGGTSYAAITLPRNSVGTVQLKRNAVTNTKLRTSAVSGAKVALNTLTGADIREASLGTVPTAEHAESANNATTATSAPLARLDYQSATVSVPGGLSTATRGTANCPTGLNATGGGGKMADPNGGFIADTNPVGKTGWEATGYAGVTQNMTVYVICAPALATTP